MTHSLLAQFGDPVTRVEIALKALPQRNGLVTDDKIMEKEGDLIASDGNIQFS